MNMLDDIATWLVSTSTGIGQIGTGTTYAVYKLQQPPSTLNMAVLYQYGGLAPIPLFDGTVDNPRLNVRTISSATSDLGYNAALVISNRLRYVVNRKVPTDTGSYYWSIEPLQSPEFIGADENGMMQWIQNFQIVVTYS